MNTRDSKTPLADAPIPPEQVPPNFNESGRIDSSPFLLDDEPSHQTGPPDQPRLEDLIEAAKTGKDTLDFLWDLLLELLRHVPLIPKSDVGTNIVWALFTLPYVMFVWVLLGSIKRKFGGEKIRLGNLLFNSTLYTSIILSLIVWGCSEN